MKPALLMLLFACSLATTAAAQGETQQVCSVRGRVVDDNGAPVPKALILVDGGPPAGWCDLIINGQADELGYFDYKLEGCPFPARAMTLYVTSPISYDNHVPFDQPFLRNGRAGKAYAGTVIRGKERGDVDLGDVRVQAVFTPVTLKLVGRDGRPLLAEDDWGDVWLRLKTSRGVWVSEGMLSAHNIETAVRAGESAIVMELPEGEWSVEVRTSRKGRPWLKPDRLVKVPRGSQPFTLTLQMDRGHRPRGD
jgi:hypothetical protein